MDNLTHSLAGAVLGQMGLKRKTGLAMPTLIVAANLPDIDAYATFLGGHQHLALRRGITHGPIALAILPVLLWVIMLAWDKWRPNEKRLPVHKGWLLALAYIGTISHPALDWLNNYGIRLLEPFSSQWFYGDTIFIIDIWIWMALIASVWISLRRERRGQGNWQRPAWIGFTAICAYIFANGLITERAERMTAKAVNKQHGIEPTLVVANAVPVQFWKRDMQWRDEMRYGYGWFTLPGNVYVADKVRAHEMDNPRILIAAGAYPDAKAYLFWSRMPVATVRGKGDERKLVISDQRFDDPRVRDRFTVSIPWKGRGDTVTERAPR
ncbi:MAG: metal-dependent hydrolase [Sphingorhabdus sp.]